MSANNDTILIQLSEFIYYYLCISGTLTMELFYSQGIVFINILHIDFFKRVKHNFTNCIVF